MENKFDPPQIIEIAQKRYGLDKSENKQILYHELEKDNFMSPDQKQPKWKRTDKQLEMSSTDVVKGIASKEIKVIVPSQSFINEQEFEKKFQAPQLISRDLSIYGLDKQANDRISYIELERGEGDNYKRTDIRFDTTGSQLANEIREGKIKVVMPSEERIRELAEKNLELGQYKQNDTQNIHNTSPNAVEKDLEPDFEPRELIKGDLVVTKGDQRDFSNIHGVTGTLHIQSGADVKLDNLEHAGAVKIDTEAKLNTPNLVEVNSDLKMDPNSKMYAPYLETVGGKLEVERGAQLNAKSLDRENDLKTEPDKQEVKPIHVEPLTARERKEVKEAIKENKLQDDKHANHLFKKFDKQLNSVPDNINGQQLSNHDKIKLLVGDLNDHKNTAYKLEKDKTISFSNEKEKGTVNSQNAQFSQAQVQKKELDSKISNEKGLRV